MSDIDKRNRLSEEPFDYQITKKGTVVIYYEGKQIKNIKDREAERLIARIKEVEENITAVQLLLAKITGNFKRGNEKIGKMKSK
ncbi:hypothetical protein [Lysinibacillus xylanilyticus]|uniref:Uncharacterized protein n=1 Tax=Lysinibacillus xylanilyticus TaxID=582475 RepID=A0ABT4EY41_9BACI|nr:hypothetical protein [Lysinibacillus xylanilyticus]MCY9549124.1 hypothetical protein [Lysinibacillus xylanilyticus]MED3801328.1 hypothetical protein [Lysinibacillus xylanilyticus]